MLRRAAARLQSLDVKSFPGGVDVENVKAVFPIGGSFDGYTLVGPEVTTSPLVGLQSHEYDILGDPLIWTALDPLPLADNHDKESRLLFAAGSLTLDAAGTATLNGKNVRIRWGIQNLDVAHTVSHWVAGGEIPISTSASNKEYDFALFGYSTPDDISGKTRWETTWRGWIPWRGLLYVVVDITDGVTTFPANSGFNLTHDIAMNSLGVRPPD